ncbi:MAG: amidase [Pseudomonadota bacterium]
MLRWAILLTGFFNLHACTETPQVPEPTGRPASGTLVVPINPEELHPVEETVALERWAETSISDLAAAMQSGALTSVALTEFYLARIDAFNKPLNAIQDLNAEALDQAAALDAERQRQGPRSALHGLPVLVKDNYETSDMPTRAGSRLFGDFQPSRDAFLVQRLRAAGAVILGKTTMHEFAYGITTVGSAFGQAGNAYQPLRNPGGSSGGSGAAAAANFAVFTMGSDTCGSIRIPAAQNNLVGLRGTQGLLSRSGIVPLSSTQDIGGPITRSVADLATVLGLLTGTDPADPQTAASPAVDYSVGLKPHPGARIGVLVDWFVQEAGDEISADVVHTALAAMQHSADWQLIPLPSPAVQAAVNRDWNGHLVLISDFARDINQYLAANPELGIADLRDLLARGQHRPDIEGSLRASLELSEVAPEVYAREIAQRQVVQDALLQLLDDHDLDALAYPTIRQVAMPLGQEQPGTNCRLSANSGLPAISVPAGFAILAQGEQMPVGLELLGRAFDEQRLLDLAFTVEQHYPQRTPPNLLQQ